MNNRTYKGKKKLIYDNGKKSNCDYNRFNDSFLNVCVSRHKTLLGKLKYIPKDLWENLSNIVGIIFLIIFSVIPILTPVLVYLDRRRIKQRYSEKELYKWRNSNDK